MRRFAAAPAAMKPFARIEKAFASMDTPLRLQAWHDAHAMRRRADEIDLKRGEPA